MLTYMYTHIYNIYILCIYMQKYIENTLSNYQHFLWISLKVL